MTRCWVALVATVILTAGASAETLVWSNILTDTSWTSAASPYIVNGDIRVRFESTLTIEAGVEIRFEGGASLATDAGASIDAAGTKALPVVFTSASRAPASGDWDGVMVYASVSSSFERCVFEYAGTCLELNVSDPTIDHCTFRSSGTGVRCLRSSPRIIGCELNGVEAAALYCWGRESAPEVSDSNFFGNGWNVYLSSYTAPLAVITAEGNWWGSDVEGAIDATIYDGDDNPSIYGVVDYDPWLSGQPVEATSWGGLKALFIE